MDTFAAMAMASLPPRREVMQRPPRHKRRFHRLAHDVPYDIVDGCTLYGGSAHDAVREEPGRRNRYPPPDIVLYHVRVHAVLEHVQRACIRHCRIDVQGAEPVPDILFRAAGDLRSDNGSLSSSAEWFSVRSPSVCVTGNRNRRHVADHVVRDVGKGAVA